jgi:hypothetical protein
MERAFLAVFTAIVGFGSLLLTQQTQEPPVAQPDLKAISKALRQQADLLDPAATTTTTAPVTPAKPPSGALLSPVQPPATFSSRLKLLGYAVSPPLDENPQGQTTWAADPANPQDVYTVGRVGRTAFRITLPLFQSWSQTPVGAPQARLINSYGLATPMPNVPNLPSLFTLADSKATVQAIYADGDKIWSVAGDDYVGGAPKGLSFSKGGKVYGPWPVDVGYTRIRHFLGRVHGRLAAGAGTGSGSIDAPWGYGLSWVQEPNEATPLTPSLISKTLVFHGITSRLDRAGDYTPTLVDARYPAPVNGVGVFLPCDQNHAFAPIGDDVVLLMPAVGTGNCGYKEVMPNGLPAPGDAAWGYRAEWGACWTTDLIAVAAGVSAPSAVLPFERFDPTTLGLVLPPTCLVQSATVTKDNVLIVAMRKQNTSTVLYAAFQINPWS